MALQGTIDTFDLGEVIEMLAAGSKTGRLGLSGDRGEGSIWFDAGKVVASTTDTTEVDGDHADVVFQLLRFDEGSFVFEQGASPSSIDDPTDAGAVLESANERLAEWREIEAVVPSMRSMVSLREGLERADVVIDRDRWTLVAAVAGGVMVQDLGAALGLDELGAGRAVKELVDLGLVEVGDEVPEPLPSYLDGTMGEEDPEPFPGVEGEEGAAEDTADVELAIEAEAAPAVEPPLPETAATFGGTAELDDPRADEPEPAPVDDWAASVAPAPERSAREQLDSLASGFGLTDERVAGYDERAAAEPFEAPATEDDYAEPMPLAGVEIPGETVVVADPEPEADDLFPIEQAVEAGQATTPLFASGPTTEAPVEDRPRPEPGEAAEVARQLANLSPEAARAVAAAARATTDEEREAALAEVAQASERPIDPDLLRKFLSSVRQ